MDHNRLSKAVVALVKLVGRLRGPGGCSWDAKQTDATIKTYLLEEAYEVLDAVEKGSPPKVCNELGDLFFQILFRRFRYQSLEFLLQYLLDLIAGLLPPGDVFPRVSPNLRCE